MIKIVTANHSHSKELAPQVKAIDLLEISATNTEGLTTVELLDKYIDMSYESYALLDEGGKCVAIAGCSKYDPKATLVTPWMIISEELLSSRPKELHRICKEYIKGMPKGITLVNKVSTGNTVCHRWLSKLGFHIEYRRTTTIGGVDFHLFLMGI